MGRQSSSPHSDHACDAAMPCPSHAPMELPEAMPSLARKGRGAVSEPGIRYDRYQPVPWDDGWGSLEDAQAALPTTLIRDSSRTAISWNDSPDIGFDRAINPYRGCEHGCIYCFARPTHAYLGYSPGLDFETKLLFKPEIASLLSKALSRPSYVPRPIALGSNTDPYQPVERSLRLTRSILDVLERFEHPVTIVTKSAGVLRDRDILARLAERKLVRVYLSVTTLDPTLSRLMEPRAASPSRRIQTLEALQQAGIPTGVLAAPMIPGLNDAELESILEQAAKVGARQAGYILLRLPQEVAPMFRDWLEHHFPAKARKVLNLIRGMRGGKLNNAEFHSRFRGDGPYAAMLRSRFQRAVKAYRLNTAMEPLDVTRFSHAAQNSSGTDEAVSDPSSPSPSQLSRQNTKQADRQARQLSLF
ncbi:PA0069 family radical SAM protein [Granulibacter bethesdensis]|uniref:Radical SAM superfamily protein n=2 Tax=Granulibacter bethesdensis TaxID=364410 RepID=Q0BQZ8_GRABC|nr:PA0069 family radical SAM protein [Granulibacter bethesdensis]ABI62754.1 Radical SAM superfamily protein [Granulibacter bethesdensis CGDNIH1]APH52616.1 Radical SAM superfamily protein [Granulibacter bethesdensis]APH65305.1 Radical SAM superfamily protein [Granulibacter bethesdensis]